MDNTTKALKLALELKNSASGYWTEKEISIIEKLIDALAQPPQHKPLTLGQKQRLWSSVGDKPTLKDRVNAYGLAIEAAHGIGDKT